MGPIQWSQLGRDDASEFSYDVTLNRTYIILTYDVGHIHKQTLETNDEKKHRIHVIMVYLPTHLSTKFMVFS